MDRLDQCFGGRLDPAHGLGAQGLGEMELPSHWRARGLRATSAQARRCAGKQKDRYFFDNCRNYRLHLGLGPAMLFP